MRWRSLRKWARTWRRARRPIAALSAGRASRSASVSPNVSRSRGSSRRMPVPGGIWPTMPPTAEATTGRDFHMASVTVRPKPSCRLFCTTTLACRWAALTRTALATGSSIGRATRRMASRCPPGERLPRVEALGEDPRPLRVVGDAVDGRSDESETRVAAAGEMVGEAAQHTLHVLQAVPARDLHDERVAGRERRRAAQDRRCPPLPVALEQADLRQEGQDPRPVQGSVLGGQRVDGGLDDPHVGTGQPWWHEGGVGEDEGPAAGEVGLQEVPRFLGERVGRVRADVAAPGRAHAVRDEVRVPSRPSAGRAGRRCRRDGSCRREPPRWPGGRPSSARPRAVPGARRRRPRRAAGCAGAS